MSQLEKLDSCYSEGSSDNVYNALCQLLTYMPLLDIVDIKCKLVLHCSSAISLVMG